MLTLKYFELALNSTLIYRARTYYENKAVTQLEQTEEGHWHARVMGSEVYEVDIVLLNKDEITSHTCNCPHEADICKHIVAVLFVLRAQLV